MIWLAIGVFIGTIIGVFAISLVAINNKPYNEGLKLTFLPSKIEGIEGLEVYDKDKRLGFLYDDLFYPDEIEIPLSVIHEIDIYANEMRG